VAYLVSEINVVYRQKFVNNHKQSAVWAKRHSLFITKSFTKPMKLLQRITH